MGYYCQQSILHIKLGTYKLQYFTQMPHDAYTRSTFLVAFCNDSLEKCYLQKLKIVHVLSYMYTCSLTHKQFSMKLYKQFFQIV